MRALLDGAEEVSCSLLTQEASLELLLRAGGCAHLLANPPQAAVTAIELCGRLPLALGIAGGIISELGTTWRHDLLPLLNEEFAGEADSIEEQVVNASLRVVPDEIRAGVEGLFTACAVFAEDAIVPDTAIDALAPLVGGAEAEGSGKSTALQRRRLVRQSLQHLLKANILRGSMESGCSVHDLVRDVMLRRAERREGGLVGMQREAVAILLAAYDAGGPASSYVAGSLHWHVRQAQQADVVIPADALLMRVLEHAHVDIRRAGALGVGIAALRASALASDAAGNHLTAAKISFAASEVLGIAAGEELQQAWSSLRKLEQTSRGSRASRALESRVLKVLLYATHGGLEYGTREHHELMERMAQLAKMASTSAADGPTQGRAMFDAEFALCMAALNDQLSHDGIVCYNGPITHEDVQQSFRHGREMGLRAANAALAAPDNATALATWSYFAYAAVAMGRRHALSEFNIDEAFGRQGVRLRELVYGYSFEAVHHVAREEGVKFDMFLFDVAPHALLLFYGDVAASSVGSAKVLDGHKRILNLVRQGVATADAYAYEAVCDIFFLVPHLYVAGFAPERLRDFMAHSLFGAALHDEAIRTGLASWFQGAFGGWKTDGYCVTTLETLLLVARGLEAHIEEDSEASRAALRAWLPSAAELLRIAEYELGWRAHALGGHLGPLQFARLHGERLGNWEAAAEVAEGVLRIEAFTPGLRTDAYRILAQARAALGWRAEACKAAELAAAEAGKARYVWLELLSLRDLLRMCETEAAPAVRSRIRGVAERCVASTGEVAQVLGPGVLEES